MLRWLGEWRSGTFSRLCFGVRLSGDRASINFAEHLGSLKPERAIQFINLNLLMLQWDRGDLWETLTGPRCSPCSCCHTHQQRRPAPPHPPTSSPLSRPLHLACWANAYTVFSRRNTPSRLGILWATPPCTRKLPYCQLLALGPGWNLQSNEHSRSSWIERELANPHRQDILRSQERSPTSAMFEGQWKSVMITSLFCVPRR